MSSCCISTLSIILTVIGSFYHVSGAEDTFNQEASTVKLRSNTITRSSEKTDIFRHRFDVTELYQKLKQNISSSASAGEHQNTFITNPNFHEIDLTKAHRFTKMEAKVLSNPESLSENLSQARNIVIWTCDFLIPSYGAATEQCLQYFSINATSCCISGYTGTNSLLHIAMFLN